MDRWGGSQQGDGRRRRGRGRKVGRADGKGIAGLMKKLIGFGGGAARGRDGKGTVEACVATVYCTMWMFVSSGLVMLNKYILSVLEFQFPMTLCSFGMLFSGVVAALLLAVRNEKRHRMTWRSYFTKILPVGLASATTLYWGNYAYLSLSVSFVQILKAFTPVVTMGVLFLFSMEEPRLRLIGSVALMTLGTVVASLGETHFSWVGFASMGVSETAEALKVVSMQYLLGAKKFSLLEGLYYFAPATFFWLFLGTVITEREMLIQGGALTIIKNNPLTFTLASGLGFCVNLLTLAVVKSTSSLTFKVLGQVKNAATVYFSMIFFRNPVTQSQVLGYGASLFGFFWYNKIKMSKAGVDNAKKEHTHKRSVSKDLEMAPVDVSSESDGVAS